MRGIDTAATSIETRAKTLRTSGADRAARIGSLIGSVDVAVCRLHRTCELTSRGYGASSIGVSRHEVRALAVDSFDDVDLATVRPIRS